MNYAHNMSGAGFESRFQRSLISRSGSWGDAPGCSENAPLALKTSTGCVGWCHERAPLALKTKTGCVGRCHERAPLALKTKTRCVGRCLLSAKGAVIMNSLGHRPRISSTAELAALKARFIPEMRS